MLYARPWAEKIFSQFHNSCTRARNTDKCILYVAEHSYSKILSTEKLHEVFISSLQGQYDKKIWPMYKRLVKKSPLDKELLNKLTGAVLNAYGMEYLQLMFEFDT